MGGIRESEHTELIGVYDKLIEVHAYCLEKANSQQLPLDEWARACKEANTPARQTADAAYIAALLEEILK